MYTQIITPFHSKSTYPFRQAIFLKLNKCLLLAKQSNFLLSFEYGLLYVVTQEYQYHFGFHWGHNFVCMHTKGNKPFVVKKKVIITHNLRWKWNNVCVLQMPICYLLSFLYYTEKKRMNLGYDFSISNITTMKKISQEK